MAQCEFLTHVIILCTVRLTFASSSVYLSPELSDALHLLRPDSQVLFASACLQEDYQCSEAEVASYAWASSHADPAARKRFWHTYVCTWNEDPSECPVDGGWTAWSEWGACNTTCGDGTKLRYRTCNWPPPKNGGNECHGQATSVTSCRVKMACPVTGHENLSFTEELPGSSVQHRALEAMEPFNEENTELSTTCLEGHCSYQQVTEMVTPRDLAA
ncbi:ectin-like [Acanthaster planci]|uniref:Ectin-like n=1 Tax=Acanthaster planci TaxID=133434 RepID=A0A8B7YHA8_ACAPL|nr:ectin-like [Acanthaster planci]